MTEPIDPRLGNIHAEQSLLGACLLKPEVASWVELEAADFVDLRHQGIWTAMQLCIDGQTPVDPETVGEKLGPRLEASGGYAYLGKLVGECLTTDNVEHYAKIIKGKAITRRVVMAGEDFRRMLDNGLAEGEELLDEALAVLGRIDRPRAGSVCLEDAIEAEKEAIRTFDPNTDWAGIPTGLADLDRESGGIPLAVTTVLAARPSEGKSSLALAIGRNCARMEKATLILTAEDRDRTMAQRALADLADVNLARLRRRTDLDMIERERIASANDEGTRRLWIEHIHGVKIQSIVRMIRAYVRLRGVELVIVDYLQKIPKMPGMNANTATEANLNAFDDAIGELDIAGLMLSQLSRECEKENRRPKMSDLRDSGAIEQVAKLILMLYPAKEDELEIIIRKNHQGARERCVLVAYDRAHCRITDREERY